MTQKDNQTISAKKCKSHGANLASNQAEHDPQNNRGLYGVEDLEELREWMTPAERDELDMLLSLPIENPHTTRAHVTHAPARGPAATHLKNQASSKLEEGRRVLRRIERKLRVRPPVEVRLERFIRKDRVLRDLYSGQTITDDRASNDARLADHLAFRAFSDLEIAFLMDKWPHGDIAERASLGLEYWVRLLGAVTHTVEGGR
jgi:hypothetical protein